MKRILLALIILTGIAAGQDTCTVAITVHEGALGGPRLMGVVCTTEVCNNGTAYVERGTTNDIGYLELKYSRGSSVRIRFIKPGYLIGSGYENIINIQSNEVFNLVALVPRFNVGGVIEDQTGDPLFGVIVTLNDTDTCITNIQGEYWHEYQYGWSGVIKPSLTNWTFSPDSIIVPPITNFTLNCHFIGEPATSTLTSIIPTVYRPTSQTESFDLSGRKLLETLKLHPHILNGAVSIKDR